MLTTIPSLRNIESPQDLCNLIDEIFDNQFSPFDKIEIETHMGIYSFSFKKMDIWFCIIRWPFYGRVIKLKRKRDTIKKILLKQLYS